MYTNQIYIWYKYSVDLRIPSSFDFDVFFFLFFFGTTRIDLKVSRSRSRVLDVGGGDGHMAIWWFETSVFLVAHMM